MAKYDVSWYSTEEKFYSNVNDLVLLAPGGTSYSDGSRIVPGRFVGGAADAVLFRSELNHLTVGGNYDGDNVSVALMVENAQLYFDDGFVVEDTSKVSNISAVRFSQDGIMHLSAKTGARTADDSSSLSDDDIRISATGSLSRSAELDVTELDEATKRMKGVSAASSFNAKVSPH